MAKKKSVVITFGRFQPPTIGHEKLINAVIAHANKIGAEHRIYASQSFDGNRPKAAITNPLQYTDKIKFMRKMFPKANIVRGNEDTNTFMRVLYQLEKEGYTTVHVVVGQDRVPEIRKTVDQYLGSSDSETGLNFQEFKVVSAGKRDPEAEGVEGMSASKLRAAAGENNFKLFKQGMPSGFSDARGLFDTIRKGLERPMKPEKKSKKSKSKVNEELLNEVTPPDDKSERFVKKAKASFKDRYGDDWASYLYGVAWKQYNKRHDRPTKTRLGEPVEEAVLHEAGVKASMEDWLEGLPKKVVQELKTKHGKTLKKAHDHGMFSVNDPEREQIRQVLIRNKVQPLMGDRSHGEGASAVLMSFWTFHGDNPSSVVDFNMKEETLQEGGVKGALEDYLYSIPKEAIEELKPVMQIKNLTKRFAMITKVLKKHGFTERFMGSMPANIVNDYYPTFFGESVEQIDELTIPKRAEVVGRNKEEKTVTLKWNDADGWHTVEVPEDEVPGFYDRAAEPLKARKTDRLGNIMNQPKAGAEKKTEKAAEANKKNAQEILDIFNKKPMKTPITVYGKKWGKTDEYEMVIMKRMYEGNTVFVVKSSGRFVELRVTGAGLQVIDVKTKKILLDKGNDATW
jgi:hypothetical protein